MSVSTWILVAGDPAVASLLEAAASLDGPVTVLAVGERSLADTLAAAPGVGEVRFVEAGDAPLEAFAGPVAGVVAEAAPAVVMASTRSADRAVLGAVAAAMRCPILTGINSLAHDGQTLTFERSVLGGIAEHVTTVTGPAALMIDGGVVPSGGGSVEVTPIDLQPVAQLTVLETRPSQHATVNLNAATRVLAAGRGVKAQDDLAMVTSLAAALGAEVACTRPLAEGLDWFGHDRYIGVSGQHLAPELYVAVGVSGQLQHMVGIRKAHTIVAINTDKDAPIFSECDYGIVGDIYDVVPALVQALS